MQNRRVAARVGHVEMAPQKKNRTFLSQKVQKVLGADTFHLQFVRSRRDNLEGERGTAATLHRDRVR